MILKNLLKRKQVQQGTQEWYQERDKLITASEVPSILGISQFETRKDCEERKLTNTQFGSPNAMGGYESPACSWGKNFEPVAKKLFEDIKSCSVRDLGLLWHKSIPWLGASPDGIFEHNNFVNLLEIKCPISKHIGEEIPEEYWVQCQIQMEVADIEQTILFCCKFSRTILSNEYLDSILYKCPNNSWFCNETKEFIVKRDRKWFSKIYKKLETFALDIQLIENNNSKRVKTHDVNSIVSIHKLYNYFFDNTVLDWLDNYGIRNGYEPDNISNYSNIFNQSVMCHSYNSKIKCESIIDDMLGSLIKEREIIDLDYKILNRELLDNHNIGYIKHFWIEYGGVRFYCNGLLRYDLYNQLILKEDNLVNNELWIPIFISGRKPNINHESSGIFYHNNKDTRIISIIGQLIKIWLGSYTVVENNWVSVFYLHKGKIPSSIFRVVLNINANKIVKDGLEYLENMGNNRLQIEDCSINPNSTAISTMRWKSEYGRILCCRKDIGLIRGIGDKKRTILINKGITSWDQNELNEICITDKTINSNIIQSNKNNKLILPNFTDLSKNYQNIFNIHNNITGIFLDIETVPDFVIDHTASCSTFPNIVLIGLGYVTGGSSWQYKFFSPNKMYDLDAFNSMMKSFQDFIQTRKNKVRIYHWSGSESKDLAKYCNGAEFVDLCALFREYKIGIPGSFSYKLKEITNALRKLGHARSSWEGLRCCSGTDSVGATIAAVVTSRKYYQNLPETEELIDLKNYNEIDCKSMCEIIIFLRNYYNL